MTAIVAVVALLVCGVVSVLALRAIRVEHDRVYQVQDRLLRFSYSHITDVENRLMSHSWQEFAGLSEVPSTLERTLSSEQIAQVSNMSLEETIDALRNQYDESLGYSEEEFAGPTLG